MRVNPVIRIALLTLSVILSAESLTASPQTEADSVVALHEKIAQLEERVELLEARLAELEAIVGSRPKGTEASDPAPDASASGTTRGTASPGSLKLTIRSFSQSEPSASLVDEVKQLKVQVQKEESEIRSLNARIEAMRKELQAVLADRARGGKTTAGQRDPEVMALEQSHSNERKGINTKLAAAKDRLNNAVRAEKSKRSAMTPKGQRIEATDGGTTYIITTKQDCSKVLSAGATISLVNPKAVSSGDGVAEFTADKVILATPSRPIPRLLAIRRLGRLQSALSCC